jgi:quercetin dioxygenase-like cupin family protein
MYNSTQDLLDAFRSAPETLQRLLFGVTQQQATTARGGDENWSVVEVICHLRDAEERALQRMRQMRDTGNPLIPGYDQEQWAVERQYAFARLDDALAAFLEFRTAHLQELAALSPAQWQRTGQHTEAGEITIFNHTLHMACHDAVHLAQIAQQLGAQPNRAAVTSAAVTSAAATSAPGEGVFRPMLDGIKMRVLGYGERTLTAEFHLKKGSLLPLHHHPHEQAGYMVSGHTRMTIGEQEYDMRPGCSWTIPGNVDHKVLMLEDTVIIEVFSPVREDYLPR